MPPVIGDPVLSASLPLMPMVQQGSVDVANKRRKIIDAHPGSTAAETEEAHEYAHRIAHAGIAAGGWAVPAGGIGGGGAVGVGAGGK